MKNILHIEDDESASSFIKHMRNLQTVGWTVDSIQHGPGSSIATMKKHNTVILVVYDDLDGTILHAQQPTDADLVSIAREASLAYARNEQHGT